VNWPQGADNVFSDWPSNPVPLITIHCHGTDPMGATHIMDTLKDKIRGSWPW